jgi:two-component system, sporulation sensor kinase D
MQQYSSLTRWVFISASAIIISLILYNTLVFFNQLKENERAKMQIWAEAQLDVASASIDINSDVSDVSLTIIQGNTTTPMILYSHKEDSYDSRNMDSISINDKKKRDAIISQFETEYNPIITTFENNQLSTIYYGNSPLINKLKYYPAILIVILILFIAAIYYFNETAKSAVQNKLWAGMAKETAHQIGTP